MNHPNVRKYLAHQVVPMRPEEADTPEVLARRRQDWHDLKCIACCMAMVFVMAAASGLIVYAAYLAFGH